MKIAVMQPYIFPYIGYFQLIKSVDKFIFYDDVNFIKGGWINRNNLLLNKSKSLFTIPLDKATSFAKINETYINTMLYENWKSKFMKSIMQSYTKAPYFKHTYSILEKVLDSKTERISDLAINSVKEICNFLDFDTIFEISSEFYPSVYKMDKLERLLSICKKNNSSDYINPIGGTDLYRKEDFESHNINLHFIKSVLVEYRQFSSSFIPWLSIIDVLMFNSVEEVNIMLDEYSLL